jgi:acyl-CoA synthetase (AMP-forming)/AMP-acid ligase II
MFSHLLERVQSFDGRPCFISGGSVESYAAFANRIGLWQARLGAWGLQPGDTIAVRSDYSHDACALIIALALSRAIVVPVSSVPGGKVDEYLDIAGADGVVRFVSDDDWQLERRRPPAVRHELVESLRGAGAPGLILFSSGSTGHSKAALLDLNRLWSRFDQPGRRPYVTLLFLVLDHIGGLNSLTHALSYGGTVVTPSDRSPEAICQAIERYRVELLPTSPTFLKMLLISGAYTRHDLSSLKLITYGTEPMPAATLNALHAAMPEVRLKQTYGLSELGILPTLSKGSASLWMKIGDDGIEHKVVDGVLWIRAGTAMLGYLNAPSPFDSEGWFNTQDAVETDGEYLRILGRRSEIINVGGEKVYPIEVEDVLLEAGNVRDATASGWPSPITGQVVVAQVCLVAPEVSAAQRLRAACAARLEPYKVPVRIDVVDRDLYGERFKKIRAPARHGSAA